MKVDLEKELRLKDNIKIDHKDVRCVDVSWINLSRCCKKWRIVFLCFNGPSGALKIKGNCLSS
jgi:hypothetical protein